MLKRWWPLLAGVAVTPVMVLIGIVSGGSGEGGYVLARLVLPWASELTGVANFNYWHTAMVYTAAFAQWPLYGLLIAWRRRAVWPLLAAHFAIVVWLFTLGKSNFGLH